jgi:hypothetical protein
MTREDIIWLARQAGLTGLMETGLIDFLERFAATVADVERANVTLAAFQVAERQIAAEREACAKEAENESNFDSTECGIDVANDIAAAIRARGQE